MSNGKILEEKSKEHISYIAIYQGLDVQSRSTSSVSKVSPYEICIVGHIVYITLTIFI